MTARESDPVKRAELHSARSLLLGVETLTSHAYLNARRAGGFAAAEKISEARERLSEAMNELVEALATN